MARTQTIAKYVDALVRKRTDDLEKRIADIERQAGELKYAGTYSEERQYKRGNFVTRSGSLWHCSAETTTAKPGDSGDWRLAAKKGTFSP